MTYLELRYAIVLINKADNLSAEKSRVSLRGEVRFGLLGTIRKTMRRKTMNQ